MRMAWLTGTELRDSVPAKICGGQLGCLGRGDGDRLTCGTTGASCGVTLEGERAPAWRHNVVVSGTPARPGYFLEAPIHLRRLQEPGLWDAIAATTARIEAAIGTSAREAGVPITQTRLGTMFCTYFADWEMHGEAEVEATYQAAGAAFKAVAG
ncbi:MAG: glutamate-1-semialdehyde aminotransferase [Rhodothermales bacterium]|jgi:glutamate-1-semialdehyde aminotransferase